MPIQGIVEGAKNPFGIGDGAELADLFRPDQLGLQAHVTMLGPFGLEEIHAIGRGGDGQAANMVEAARLSADLFQLAIELDRVALQGGNVGVGIYRVEAARGMPGGA